MLCVHIPNQGDDRFRRFGGSKRIDELIVAHVPGRVVEGPQVRARLIGRGDQQKENVGWMIVERCEIHAFSGCGDAGDELVHGRVPRMRDGDAPADTCRTQLFTTQDRLDDTFAIARGERASLTQPPDDFADHALFVGRLEIDGDRLGDQKFEQLHQTRPFLTIPELLRTSGRTSTGDSGHVRRSLPESGEEIRHSYA